MRPYAGVDNNLILCRLKHIYHGHGHLGNPMPESTLSPSQGLRIWPLRESDRIQGYVVFVLWRVTQYIYVAKLFDSLLPLHSFPPFNVCRQLIHHSAFMIFSVIF